MVCVAESAGRSSTRSDGRVSSLPWPSSNRTVICVELDEATLISIRQGATGPGQKRGCQARNHVSRPARATEERRQGSESFIIGPRRTRRGKGRQNNSGICSSWEGGLGAAGDGAQSRWIQGFWGRGGDEANYPLFRSSGESSRPWCQEFDHKLHRMNKAFCDGRRSAGADECPLLAAHAEGE